MSGVFAPSYACNFKPIDYSEYKSICTTKHGEQTKSFPWNHNQYTDLIYTS